MPGYLSFVTQIPQLFELKARPSFLLGPRVLCMTAVLHMHPWGAGAPRSLPMDGTLVNVNGQIVCWNEFHPFFPVSWPSCYFYICYWWLHNQSFVYFPDFLGMIWSFKPDFSNCDSWGSFSSMTIKKWTYSTMDHAGNNKNPPNIWKLNVQWILMKKINRFNLLQ